MKLEKVVFETDGSKGPPNIYSCDMCVLDAKKCGRGCIDHYYKFKEHWVVCTRDNIKIGETVVGIVSGDEFEVMYIHNKTEEAVFRHKGVGDDRPVTICHYKINLNK